SLEITRQNPHQEEKIIYYIMNGEEKYIFKAVFPADRTEETTVVSLYIDPPVSMEETQWADTLGEYAPMAREVAPKILKSYMRNLQDRDGLHFLEARITGMDVERINTGTASDLAMFRMDFALISEEVLVIPDGCTVEDGWITGEIWWNSPNLVLNAVG
ncbi:MAG: hypothetical protein IKV57_07965, partial [Clostridia bacterium]|nr:hypothetical protein [Clostridia bacterium]